MRLINRLKIQCCCHDGYIVIIVDYNKYSFYIWENVRGRAMKYSITKCSTKLHRSILRQLFKKLDLYSMQITWNIMTVNQKKKSPKLDHRFDYWTYQSMWFEYINFEMWTYYNLYVLIASGITLTVKKRKSPFLHKRAFLLSWIKTWEKNKKSSNPLRRTMKKKLYLFIKKPCMKKWDWVSEVQVQQQ